MRGHLEEVEVDCLCQRSALSNDSNVTNLHPKGRRTVNCNVPVPLFVSVVLGDIVEVIPSDNNGPVHLGGDDNALQDLAPDGDPAGEWALLIDVGALDSLSGSFEAESNVLVVPDTAGGLFGEEFFAVEEDVVLFLEGFVVLAREMSTWMSAMVLN
jgi:hypothetical protein